MRFEKWQALGNDYLIVERANLDEPLTPELVRFLCDPHRGVGADGVLELSAPDAPGFVARLRIFNPDGSEAELSGNGAREAVLYLRASGWTDEDEFSILTKAGPVRPTIIGPNTAGIEMGSASVTSLIGRPRLRAFSRSMSTASCGSFAVNELNSPASRGDCDACPIIVCVAAARLLMSAPPP